MTLTPASSSPQGPCALLQQACDPQRSEEERRQAVLALRPVIERVARRVATRFGGQVGHDLLDEALSVVVPALASFDLAWADRLEGWLARVLYNHGVDLRRQTRSREPLRRACTGGNGVAGVETPDRAADTGQQRLDEWRRQVRQHLDRLRRPAPGRGLDYHALWLVQLRLRLAASVARSFPDGEAPPGEVAAITEVLVPWDDEESARRLRPEGPTVAEVWRMLAPRLDATRAGLDAATICEALRAAPRCDPAVTVPQWNQWMHRAREEARRRLPTADWGALFAAWWPDATAPGRDRS